MLSGAEDGSLVQAILISVFYQQPSEASAWRKLGWAIRLGYQLRWHERRKRPLPSTDRDKRLTLVSDRAMSVLTIGC